jgi:hypothetical protein
MPQIEQIYCDYCKRHETAVIRLQELECKPEVQTFFKVIYIEEKGEWGDKETTLCNFLLTLLVLLFVLLDLPAKDSRSYNQLGLRKYAYQACAKSVEISIATSGQSLSCYPDFP